jgi:hypothetical protein
MYADEGMRGYVMIGLAHQRLEVYNSLVID